MDLRSGHAYWLLKNGLIASYPPLAADRRCDVAIIGAGITGALIAYHLVLEGVDAILIDKRDVANGSTAASTCLLQYEIDKELHDLIGLVGEDHAVRAYRLGLESIDRIEELTHELGDPCGFTRKESLYLASRPSHLGRLREEFDCRRRFGFDVEFLDARRVSGEFPFKAPGAILSRGDAQVDAYRFTHALLRESRKLGLEVHDRTAMVSFEVGRRGVKIRTDRGPTIAAKRIVFATGYESRQYLEQDSGTLHSTFAAVSEPMEPFPEWPGRCLIWETARPYFYLRPTDDGRILMGGLDTPVVDDKRRDRMIGRKTAALVRRFQRMFPDADFEVAYAWAGTFGETEDGLAYIGECPGVPRADFALGYGGNGITMSMIAARLIADRHVGRKNPDAAIFRFGR